MATCLSISRRIGWPTASTCRTHTCGACRNHYRSAGGGSTHVGRSSCRHTCAAAVCKQFGVIGIDMKRQIAQLASISGVKSITKHAPRLRPDAIALNPKGAQVAERSHGE